MRATCLPAVRRAWAQVSPAMPAPITMASYCSDILVAPVQSNSAASVQSHTHPVRGEGRDPIHIEVSGLTSCLCGPARAGPPDSEVRHTLPTHLRPASRRLAARLLAVCAAACPAAP